MSLADRLQSQQLLPEDITLLDHIVDRDGVRLHEAAKRLGKSLDETVAVLTKLLTRGLLDYNLTTGYTVTRAGLHEVQEMDEYGDFVVKVGGKAQTHNVTKYLSKDEIEALGGYDKAVELLSNIVKPHVASGSSQQEVEKLLHSKTTDVKKARAAKSGACKPGEKMVFGTCRAVGATKHEDKLQETGTFSASVGGRAPAQIHGASTATGAMTPERAKKLKRLAQERERARERLRELAQESRGLPRRPLRTLGA